ncbi:lipopolysaccharide biosynthesis protein [Micromonospora siamensis]|uniref:Capsular polysaccharide biosynthesis protein n=1 Tax=Micromonospora siamensis TaxID=299152 RepID=A0A1C5I3D4_9ACTN|nr:lipopolysaccharide biosynthesis protein [Micromonospora siamensis]SCG52794.1 hypothetical protein GA0074704_2835 [Micromonospora siamensis]
MTDRTPAPWPADGWAAGSDSRTVTLGDLLRVPLHRLRLIGVTALVGLLGALGYVLLAGASVTANAVVAVRPVVTDAFSPSGAGADRSVNMNVESGIATGTDVVGALSRATGEDPVVVRELLQVEVPTGGQILRFTYQGDGADAAVDAVNLAAQTYLDVRRQMYEKQRADMLRSYDDSIAKVAKQQASLQKRVNGAKGSAAADAAVAELAGINNQLTQLNSSRTEIAAVDVNPGWITQRAEPALVTSDGKGALLLVAGLLGGVLLGVVLAYAWEAMDRRVRSVADARDATGLPLLGTVRRRRFRGRAQPVDADVRYVAMAVAERVGKPARVALLAAREDTTVLTAGLAVALAAGGREVFIADDSGRLDRLRGIVQTDRGRLPVPIPGRSSVPASRPSAEDDATAVIPIAGSARRPSPHPSPAPASTDPEATLMLPRIATAKAGTAKVGAVKTGTATGSSNGTPAAGGGSRNGRAVDPDSLVVGTGRVGFGTWRQGADQKLVLFNAPPAEADERGVSAARQGTAVVVVERDRTRQSDLRRLVERLRAAGVTPLGFVLNRSGRG